ncbi:hypothetical protein GCM10023116_48290 [Kistimonas scapharcae]|uniref:Uncharacterized protein n=1 Tax=Kistimonas scapharcae TaxID=1036133 RepID=A0ABP8V965_9GAMM
MASDTSLNPHIRDNHSDLQALTRSAIRRYGDFAPNTIEGEAALMFVELANMIVDEINQHPYWLDDPIEYYTHMTDARPIPDMIITNGLLFQYSLQQGSPKSNLYGPMFYQTMNKRLYQKNFGTGKIALQVHDR